VEKITAIEHPADGSSTEDSTVMRHHAFWIIFGVAVCCAAGCGPKVANVTGKVTYNGKPLNEEGCNIVFQGTTGQSVVAPVAENGEYKASGVLAGANKVAVYYRSPGATIPRERGVKAPPSNSPLRNLPRKYGDVNTSELSVDVDIGTVFNVDMNGPALK
jgi:hypothetical protein